MATAPITAEVSTRDPHACIFCGGRWSTIGQRVHPEVCPNCRKPESVVMCRETATALIALYEGMLAAGASGIGYSPRTADAMKRLRDLHPVELKIEPVVLTGR